jgi:hypothetical protein
MQRGDGLDRRQIMPFTLNTSRRKVAMFSIIQPYASGPDRLRQAIVVSEHTTADLAFAELERLADSQAMRFEMLVVDEERRPLRWLRYSPWLGSPLTRVGRRAQDVLWLLRAPRHRAPTSEAYDRASNWISWARCPIGTRSSSRRRPPALFDSAAAPVLHPPGEPGLHLTPEG